jgi:DNA-binding LacI/PurR family transcriptional regulator
MFVQVVWIGVGVTRYGRPGRVTLADVAAEAGVSTATASNAFNQPDRTSDELRRRVLEVAERLGYSPDPMARGLRRGRAGAIGVLLAERPTYAFSDPAGVALLDGLAEALGSDDTGFLVLSGDGRGGGPTPGAVAGAVVDAFVSYALPDDDPCIDALMRRRVPLIIVEGPTLATGWSVGIDDETASRRLIEHLLAHRHRDVGVVAMECRPDGREGLMSRARRAHVTYGSTRRRLDGCVAELRAAGIETGALPVYECAHNHPSAGRSAAVALLAARPRPTALICQSDQLALGALAAADQLGLAVPADLSIVGFDDIEAASHTSPPLTTVRQPLRYKGIITGQLVAEALAGEPERQVVLPAELVVRESTGPPPA